MIARSLSLALVFGACQSTPPQKPPVATASEQADSARVHATGGLSEAEFQALHQHRGDDAPTPRGTMVDLLPGGARAYLSLPEGASPPLPGVVVIHEWWGLNEHIRHWADRLASAGFAALAVDLYGGKTADRPDDAMALMKAVDPEEAVRLLLAAHAFLAEDGRVRATRRASIGWCFGGGMSLALALATPNLDACVLYYGRPVTESASLQKIQARVLGVFGTLDPSIPPDMVDAFEQALDDAGVPHRILRYDAQHAFANPSSARYDRAAAEDAWRRVRRFLASALMKQ